MGQLNKFTVFLTHGENTIELEEDLVTEYNSILTVRNASVFWEHENIRTDVNDTIAYNSGTITLEPGYWTFEMLQKHLKTVGLTLDKIEHQSRCIVQVSSGNTANLKNFGPLLGFPFADKAITATSLAKSEHKVEINSGMRYVTIASNLVNRSKNFNSYGKRSTVISTLPITSTQNLNGTVNSFGDLNNSVILNNGVHKRLHFEVGNNVDVSTQMSILLEFEVRV